MPRPIISGGLLTEREAQIAGLLAQGYTKKEIALKLYLSIYTVQTHVSHIFRKCGVGNKVQLARWWIGAAAVEPSEQAVGRSQLPSNNRHPPHSGLGTRALRLAGLAALITALLLGFNGGLVSQTLDGTAPIVYHSSPLSSEAEPFMSCEVIEPGEPTNVAYGACTTGATAAGALNLGYPVYVMTRP